MVAPTPYWACLLMSLPAALARRPGAQRIRTTVSEDKTVGKVNPSDGLLLN